MKKLLVFWLVIISSSSIYGQTAEFYEKLLADFDSRNSYFIALDVESDSYSGKIVVENGNLFDYLNESKGLDEQAYKSFMLKLFKENQKLKLNTVAIDKSGFYLEGKGLKKHSFRIVETSQEFEIVSAQGCKRLIQYYFGSQLSDSEVAGKSSCKESIKRNAKDLLIMPRYNLTEQNNVISKLFEMGIPIYLDDISGSLKIGYHTLN